MVVFGGGSVGVRRAQKFAKAGARVRVVAKEFKEELYDLQVELVKADLKDEKEIMELMEDAHIVVIATDNKELNDKIYEIVRKTGKLVNDATNAKRSDIHVPFETEVDGIRVAVTSEGASGVGAHLALMLIQHCLKNNTFWRNINQFARKFKEWIKEAIDNPKKRFGLYWYVLLNDNVVLKIYEGKIDEALKEAQELVMNYEGEGIRDLNYAIRKFLERWGDELLGRRRGPWEDQRT